MKIAIIGAGKVGSTLGSRLAKVGHDLTYALRNPSDAKYAELAGERVQLDTISAAVVRSELVILATPWGAAESAVKAAGDFAGKTLVDATNPIGPGLVLTIGRDDSGAEQVSRWAANASVVKAFNSTGVENMANPSYGADRATMLVAGDDEAACAQVVTLCEDLGFEGIRLGELARARVLEPAAVLWIRLAMELKSRDMAFKLVRRSATQEAVE